MRVIFRLARPLPAPLDRTMGNFSGKSVAVTGGAKGIGRAICEEFASAGARVFCIDLEIGLARSERVFLCLLHDRPDLV